MLALALVATLLGEVPQENPGVFGPPANPYADKVPTYVRPRWSRSDGRQSRSGADDLAFFEFAPKNGQGLGLPCACAAVTGAKGEAVTFTRASSATCTRTSTGGLATTGIANGDLAACGNNLPRVMYDSEGFLGLLVEEGRTNNAPRSQELENAAWTAENLAGAAAPDRTGVNTAIAPDGTLTADRVIFGASAGAQDSILVPVGSCSVGVPCIITGYVKGVSGSGTLDFCGGTTAATCAPCAYNPTTWTRCQGTASALGGPNPLFGNATVYNGLVARPINDVYAWGLQVENNVTFATSYIPTTTIAVARVVETASVALVGTSTQSIAVSRNGPVPPPAATAQILLLTRGAAVGAYGLGVYHLATQRTGIVGTPGNTTVNVSGAETVQTRAWASWDGTTATFNFEGTQATATPGGTLTAVVSVNLGFDSSAGNGQTNGIISRVCVDPSSTRCR